MNFSPIDSTNLGDCVELFVAVFNAPPWNENWSPKAVATRLEECLGAPGFYGLLAAVDERSAGFALGYIEQWDQIRHFYLKEMCVASTLQRSGMGTAFMGQLEANLQERGVERIYLCTARDSGAQQFYDKQGFYTSSKMVMMSKWLNNP